MKIQLLLFSLLASVSFAGGTSSGGGNTIDPTPVSIYRVKMMLEEIRKPLKYFFNYYQFYARSEPGLKASYNLVFPKNNPQLIFQLINVYKPNVLMSGACTDENGNDVDASIVNTPDNTICFSVERISQKLNNGEAFVKILALAAHEYSHHAGTSEAEAELLQKYVELVVKSDYHNDWHDIYGSQKIKFDNLFQNFTNPAAQLTFDRELPTICIGMGFLTASSVNAIPSQATSGMSIFPLESFKKMKALAMMSIALSMGCNDNANEHAQVDIGMFKGLPQISITDIFNDGLQYPGVMRNIQYKDVTAMKEQFIEMTDLIKQVNDDLNNQR